MVHRTLAAAEKAMHGRYVGSALHGKHARGTKQQLRRRRDGAPGAWHGGVVL